MDETFPMQFDENDCISALAHIFQLNPKLLRPNELDDILLHTYKCLNGLHLVNPLSNIVSLLNAIETKQHIILSGKFKISPYNQWFCKFVILASLKHCRDLFRDDCDNVARNAILRQCIVVFRPDRSESIHLLRLVAKLANFLDWKSDLTISVELVNFAQTVALSPLNGFKQLAEDISEAALFHVSAQQRTNFLYVDFLPIRGVSTLKLERYFSSLFLEGLLFQKIIVTRIIEMFSNNIENREGGSFYRILLNGLGDDFDAWKRAVWPQFYKKFHEMDCEGEFFQSLLKYWIPQSIVAYQSRFYHFVSETSIPNVLKGYILLEIRKRHLDVDVTYKDDFSLLKILFSQEETRALAFQIVCSSLKKNVPPSAAELIFVWQFLGEQSDALYRDEVKALQKLVAHLNILIVGNTLVQKEYSRDLKWFLIALFKYGSSLLRTNRNSLGAQLLTALCIGLRNHNKPSRNEVTHIEEQADDFYQFLEHLNSQSFAKSVEQALLESGGLSTEISHLATQVVSNPETFTNEFLMSFIDEASNEFSIQASDSVKNITHFVASVNANQGKRGNVDRLRITLYNSLITLFENNLATNNCPKDIFKAVLLLEALNQVCRFATEDANEVLEGIRTVCFPVAARMLWQRNAYCNTQYFQDYSIRLNIQNKMEKILEALYNNLCDHLLLNKNIWTSMDLPTLISELVLVIERSSMRRPTANSAVVLRQAASVIDAKITAEGVANQDEEAHKQRLANFKIKLLHQTLKKLEQVAPVQNLTIRRNPETRFVLHALCISDSSPNKQFLTWTLSHLLKVLSSKETISNAAIAATLHCTEILLSDNNMYSHTLKYAPEVILACVRHFENRNWVVRNASVQLEKALIDRFLGVQIGRNNRAKSVDDLFQLFPQIALPFLQVISQKPLTDSALAVMQFFSESQLKSQPYSTRISLAIREAFLQSFVVLIKENADVYGLFAVRAYVSLCLEHQIADIVVHIVDFTLENYKSIRAKHTIRNFTLLLQELHDKYLALISEKPRKPQGFYVMHQSLERLTKFLSSFCHPQQLDCVLVKVNSDVMIMTSLHHHFNINDYQQRMWLHNYLPFLVLNANLPDLPDILDVILSKEVPECLQVKVLSIIVDRFTKEGRFNNHGIVGVLVRHALNIEITINNYLVMCHFKVILLLIEECSYSLQFTTDLVHKIRQCYDDPNPNTYKIFICLLILSTIESKTDEDKAFVKSAIKHFQRLHLSDEDFSENVSEMLKYLYKNYSYCQCAKKMVLKLALLLLVEHGLWHFVSFITKSHISTPIRAMQKLLNFEFLRTFFDSDTLAYEFVKEFYDVACLMDNTSKRVASNCETYYVETKDSFVDKDCIGWIVMKFLYELCRFRKMDDRWRICLDSLRKGNKIGL